MKLVSQLRRKGISKINASLNYLCGLVSVLVIRLIQIQSVCKEATKVSILFNGATVKEIS